MTRDELAALSDEQLDVRIALDLMGWTTTTKESDDGTYTEWHSPWQPWGVWPSPLAYTRHMSAAWEVVQRVTRIPQSKEEAERAPNTRFGYAFEREAFRLACSSEQEAARWICIEALLAWHSGPLFPEENADGL